MKKITILLLFCNISLMASAQEVERPDQMREMYRNMRSELKRGYNDHKQKLLDDYESYLNQTWQEFKIQRLEPVAPSPIITPPTKQDDVEEELQEIVIDSSSVITSQIEAAPTSDHIDIMDFEQMMSNNISVNFYGADLQLCYNPQTFNTKNPILETEVVQFWKEIKMTNYSFLLSDLEMYKDKLQLNGGAFYLMVEHITEQIPSFVDDNQRVAFNLFLLLEAGYDVKIARIDDDFLALLINVEEDVYSYPYSIDSDEKRYSIFTDKVIDSETTVKSYSVTELDSNQIPLSFRFAREVALPYEAHQFSLVHNGFKLQGELNKNRIDFYNDYPVCDISVYNNSHMDSTTKEQILSSIESQLKGYNTYDAINKLLAFMQFGIGYSTDTDQFGQERPLFAEEVLYYSKCDCEDKSILFAYLVKNCLLQETLLLEYPDHIAVAIGVDPNGAGRYFKFQDKIYTCCDPTYNGSSLGDCMPDYRDLTPKIIR
ncbi:MAG: hypothetical protein R3Y08_01600 [Rikenellaceae bacterium]